MRKLGPLRLSSVHSGGMHRDIALSGGGHCLCRRPGRGQRPSSTARVRREKPIKRATLESDTCGGCGGDGGEGGCGGVPTITSALCLSRVASVLQQIRSGQVPGVCAPRPDDGGPRPVPVHRSQNKENMRLKIRRPLSRRKNWEIRSHSLQDRRKCVYPLSDRIDEYEHVPEVVSQRNQNFLVRLRQHRHRKGVPESTGTKKICEVHQSLRCLTHERESAVESSSALNTKTCS